MPGLPTVSIKCPVCSAWQDVEVRVVYLRGPDPINPSKEPERISLQVSGSTEHACGIPT